MSLFAELFRRRRIADLLSLRSVKRATGRGRATATTVLSIDQFERRLALAVTPGAPIGVIPAAGPSQVGLVWTVPPSNGGTAITGYRVEYKLAPTTVTTWTEFPDGVSTATTATVTGLTNGSAYVFRVSAKNALGLGTPSEQSVAVKPNASGFTQPDAPLLVMGTSGNTQVSLSWSAGATGGTAITGYIVQYSSNNGGSWTTFSSGVSTRNTVVTGLVNGTPYVFLVAAVNAVGTSAVSANSAPVTPATVPFLLGSPTVRAGAFPDQVILRWQNPALADSGGSPVTGYTIQYSLNNGTSWRPWDSALPKIGIYTEYTANGLEIGTQIWFRVAAVNRVGTGNWITSVGITPRV
jgi:titin